jgi:hypothetical protein
LDINWNEEDRTLTIKVLPPEEMIVPETDDEQTEEDPDNGSNGGNGGDGGDGGSVGNGGNDQLLNILGL